MGLFDWLLGKKTRNNLAVDRIWLTKQAKLAGIQKEIAQAIADPAGFHSVFAIAHFKDCLAEIRAAAADFDPNRVLITLADAFVSQPRSSFGFAESGGVLIVVGERHPLPSYDDAIEELAANLPCCRLVYHLSLEDAFLLRFGGEEMIRTLRKLGMKEDEAIESRMVSRRLRAAQRKVEKVALVDPHADSAEKWFERNRPGTR
jgi:hypothetical protein